VLKVPLKLTNQPTYCTQMKASNRVILCQPFLNEQSVIFNEEMVDGRGGVTTDERLLQGG